MANTVIQLKHSLVTDKPSALNIAEPAYSYSSNTFYIGSPSGTGSIAIGGKFYLDQQQVIYDRGNSAFAQSNSAASYANAAFAAANTASLSSGAYAHANAAFNTANASFTVANNALDRTTGGSITGSIGVTSNVYAGNVIANSGFTSLGGTTKLSLSDIGIVAIDVAGEQFKFGASGIESNKGIFGGAFGGNKLSLNNETILVSDRFDLVKIQTGENGTVKNEFSFANNAFIAPGEITAGSVVAGGINVVPTLTSSFSTANAAFTRANNAINANTGGTITGDLNITGNLVIGGNTSYINTEILTVEDSLIKLANNNTTGDVLDIGFYGLYNSSGQKYAGLARPAATDTFFLFRGLTTDPTANALASGSVTAANAATLIANVQAYSVTINGQDIDLYATNAYTQANTAVANALAASSAANAAFAAANSANATDTTQNNSITAAFTAANSAGVYANGAFAAANAATATDTTQNNSITAAFATANAAFLVANGAAFVANTDYTNLSISAGDYGSASAVAAFKVEANGRISSANSTAIAIDAAAITSGTLGITRGGTGAATFTNNGVLLGQGTSAFSTASSSQEGHVLTINASGVPAFSYLSGGTF